MNRLSFRKPRGNIRGLAESLEHAANCQDFFIDAPIVYLTVGATSYVLRLQHDSTTGPECKESAPIQTRRVLGQLLANKITASARIPRASEFLTGIKPCVRCPKCHGNGNETEFAECVRCEGEGWVSPSTDTEEATL